MQQTPTYIKTIKLNNITIKASDQGELIITHNTSNEIIHKEKE